MLNPECPLCGELTCVSTAGSLAFDLADVGAPVPALLRALLEARGWSARVFRCSCGWSGVLV